MLDGKDDKILRLDVTEVGLVRDGKGAATKIIDSSGVLYGKSVGKIKINHASYQDNARYCDIG